MSMKKTSLITAILLLSAVWAVAQTSPSSPQTWREISWKADSAFSPRCSRPHPRSADPCFRGARLDPAACAVAAPVDPTTPRLISFLFFNASDNT